MQENLLYEFSIDQKKNIINVRREYEAPLKLLWEAWTSEDLLDRWWGPKPWNAETKSMDFREGGQWLYAMVGPDGERHWAKAKFSHIEPQLSFSYRGYFCDDQGVTTPELPQNDWHISFHENNTITTIKVTLLFSNTEALEQTMGMGFKEGFTAGLNQLESLLENLKK